MQELTVFTYKIGIFNDKYILSVRKPITAPTTISGLKKSIYKRNLYGRVWGLAWEATLLAVEQDNNEIVTYLQGYISRKRKGDDYTAHERSTTDEISNNVCEVETDKVAIEVAINQKNQKVNMKKTLKKTLKM